MKHLQTIFVRVLVALIRAYFCRRCPNPRLGILLTYWFYYWCPW